MIDFVLKGAVGRPSVVKPGLFVVQSAVPEFVNVSRACVRVP